MNYQNILFEAQAGIARLTLNRPDKLNSFTGEMHAELRDALDRVQPTVRFASEHEPAFKALKASLPENLKSWEVADGLADLQLKVALQYLNSGASVGRSSARAPR